MTKKDYEAFAGAINRRHNNGQIVFLTVAIANDVFSADNPKFNKAKFEEACYTGKHIRNSIKGGF